MEKKYADVIVDISADKLDRIFQYKIRKEDKAEIHIGSRVEIPFGKANRLISGYVIGFSEDSDYHEEKIKEIKSVLTRTKDSQGTMIALAEWMRLSYGCTMNQALKTVLPAKKKDAGKKLTRVSLKISKEFVEQTVAEMKKKGRKAQARLLEVLSKKEEIIYEDYAKNLKLTRKLLESLEKQDLIFVSTNRRLRNPINTDTQKVEHFELSMAQKSVVQSIFREWESENVRPTLIYGITGSGKTLVYMELIKRILAEKKQVIVLIPEISLTYQTVKRFYGIFNDKVSFLHSKMTLAEREEQFERAKRGDIEIVVGPRSALFTPFLNLGLIIIDEEHEASYKSETIPRYHARETAIKRASLENAKVVMGSATPSIEAFYRGKQGEYLLCYLSQRYQNRSLAKTSIVDMREELKMGNRSILSRQLEEKIKERLDRKEQIILFLNRRGYAGFVICRSCGEIIKCPHCDVSLSLHGKDRLLCHYCGYERPMVDTCPTCSSPYIGGFAAGTQQIESLMKKKFPKARLLRMDMDTTRHKDDYEDILSAFSEGQADILIGTQMIVKGHDFEKVTLVGVLAADLSLNSNGFRGGEKTFQLITQAIGRAGRGNLEGEALIQTYRTQDYSILYAAKQNYEAFYEEELLYRKLLSYPPVFAMTAIFASGHEEGQVKNAMDFIKKYIQRIYTKEDLQIIGPARETIGKVKDTYRWVIYLKHPQTEVLQKLWLYVEKYIEINPGFAKIRVQFDFNQ